MILELCIVAEINRDGWLRQLDTCDASRSVPHQQRTRKRQYIPQEASPFDSGPETDEGGVLGERLDTDGLGDSFVFVRNRPGDCVGVGAAVGGT